MDRNQLYGHRGIPRNGAQREPTAMGSVCAQAFRILVSYEFSYDTEADMSVPASDARQRLFPLIEEVNRDQTAVEIVSKKGTAYLISAGEYRSLQETVYLLRSPANARRLHESIAQVESGEIDTHELLG
jgi:antitoxin YefM